MYQKLFSCIWVSRARSTSVRTVSTCARQWRHAMQQNLVRAAELGTSAAQPGTCSRSWYKHGLDIHDLLGPLQGEGAAGTPGCADRDMHVGARSVHAG